MRWAFMPRMPRDPGGNNVAGDEASLLVSFVVSAR